MTYIRALSFVSAVLLLTPSLAQAAKPAAKPIVAVFDMHTKRIHLRRGATAALTAYLVSRLTSSGAYQVVPRDQLKTALRKQKTRSYKRCYKQSCHIAIGQELSAHKSLASEVMRIGKHCVVTLALYDLKKATTDRGADASGRCGEDALMVSIKRAVSKLVLGASSRPSAIGPRLSARKGPPASKTARSLRYWERRCDNGEGKACANASSYYYLGRGVRKDVPKAISLQRDACSKKVATSCHFLGLAYHAGRSLPQNYRQAAIFFAKACRLGRAKACSNLGLFVKKGWGVRKDLTKAKALYRRACRGNVSDGCNNLAMTLALRKERLQEAFKAANKAVRLSTSYATVDTLAFVLLQMKAYRWAEKMALKAIELAPKKAVLRRRLASIRAAARAAERRSAAPPRTGGADGAEGNVIGG
jgi:TPR repeat protein